MLAPTVRSVVESNTVATEAPSTSAPLPPGEPNAPPLTLASMRRPGASMLDTTRPAPSLEVPWPPTATTPASE